MLADAFSVPERRPNERNVCRARHNASRPTPSDCAPHLLDAPGACSTTSRSPALLLLYGEEYVNLALADEFALDGYEVRRAIP